MRISKAHGFIYVSAPKVGTHSIYKILEEHFPEGLLERGFHSNRVPDRFRDLFRWTLCRNPFTRAVSLWWSACRCAHKDQYRFRRRCGATDDFPRFMTWLANTSEKERQQEILMMNQTQWLKPVEPIHAIQIEHLASDLPMLPFWKEGIEIPQLNTTDQKIVDQGEREGQPIHRPSHRQLLANEEARLAVLEWAGADFDRFGYAREVP